MSQCYLAIKIKIPKSIRLAKLRFAFLEEVDMGHSNQKNRVFYLRAKIGHVGWVR